MYLLCYTKVFETKKEEEDLNGLVKVLSFCFPFVGGLVYLNHKGSSPKKNKSLMRFFNIVLKKIQVALKMNYFKTQL